MSTSLLQPASPAAAATPIAQPRSQAPSSAPAAPAESAPAMPNPRLRIDPALSLVVIEFRDSVGEVSLSIPTPKELEAYRDQPKAEPEPAPQVDVSR
ncbi:hypothetical protein G3576_14935 [Roseomonas stagni]|uniref:Uncharacterized protein n=1 Tax=Falsiroseomonas algicola TaxID=2716930 RepID=A0A6M1LLV6_9PROT|nr:hypothetical protein [Falsiroseomonas algicola]NGM21316.1 hypothetical protein [Falsiroseomonas algicola]